MLKNGSHLGEGRRVMLAQVLQFLFSGLTIFLVEQNAFAALAIAGRGFVLGTSSVTLTGTGQELISNEQVRAAYLGM